MQNDEPSPRNGSEHVATFGKKRKNKTILFYTKPQRARSVCTSCVALPSRGKGSFPHAATWLTPTRVLQHSSGTRSCKRSASLPHVTPAVNATMRRTVARGSWDLWILLTSTEPGSWNATWEYSCKRKLQAGTAAPFKKARAMSPKDIHIGVLDEQVRSVWSARYCPSPPCKCPCMAAVLFCPSTDVAWKVPKQLATPISHCWLPPKSHQTTYSASIPGRTAWNKEVVMCDVHKQEHEYKLTVKCFACWQMCLPQSWPSQIFLLLPLVLWLCVVFDQVAAYPHPALRLKVQTDAVPGSTLQGHFQWFLGQNATESWQHIITLLCNTCWVSTGSVHLTLPLQSSLKNTLEENNLQTRNLRHAMSHSVSINAPHAAIVTQYIGRFFQACDEFECLSKHLVCATSVHANPYK